MKNKIFVWFVMGLTTAVLTIPRINFAQVTILENRPQAAQARLAVEATAPRELESPWDPWYLIEPCQIGSGFEATNERDCDIDADSNDDLELETPTSLLTMAKDVRVYSEVPDPSTDNPDDRAYTDLLSLEPLEAGPNQPRSLYARFVVTRPSAAGDDVKHMAEGRIECFEANGKSHSYVTTTQNIWDEGSQITMVARMLFKPAAIGMYTCKARARVAKCAKGEVDSVNGPNEKCMQRHLVFKSGEGNTEFVYSSPTWGIGWGTGNDSKHEEYKEDDKTYVAATHIHKGITAPAQVYFNGVPTGDRVVIGDQEYVAKSAIFTIPDGPTTFNAYSGIHMTSCVDDDTSCFPGARFGGHPDISTSVVDLRIIATQLHTDGSICVQHVGPTKRLTILGDSHHQKANIIYNGIPIHQCGKSRRFTVKTYVERVSGNPVRVERGDVRDGGKFTGYTHTGVYADY
jgi:hypothetical protein